MFFRAITPIVGGYTTLMMTLLSLAIEAHGWRIVDAGGITRLLPGITTAFLEAGVQEALTGTLVAITPKVTQDGERASRDNAQSISLLTF